MNENTAEEFGKMIVKGLEIQDKLKKEKEKEVLKIKQECWRENKASFMPVIEYIAKHKGEWTTIPYKQI